MKVSKSAVEENQAGAKAKRTSTITLKKVPMIMKGRRRPMRKVTKSEIAPTRGLTTTATSVPQITTRVRLMSFCSGLRNFATMLGITIASKACQ